LVLTQHLFKAVESLVASDLDRRQERIVGKDQAYARLVFALGVAIARELVNCFVDFLTGAPPKYFKIGYGFHQAPWGREWQATVLGGIVTSREEPGHLLGVRQGGTLWCVIPRACRIKEEAIQKVVNGCEIPGPRVVE